MARLTSAVLTSALIRKTTALGGFAMVLQKGDETSGAILIIQLKNGVFAGFWERALDPRGHYQWMAVGPQNVENKDEIDQYPVRRRQNDPDLWVIELDIVDAAQFAALIAAVG